MHIEIKIPFYAEFIDHGWDSSQYFPGCGTSGTEYEGVVTGCGHSLRDAIEDALDNIATSGELEEMFERGTRETLVDLLTTTLYEGLTEEELDYKDADPASSIVIADGHTDWNRYVSIRFGRIPPK